MIQVKGLSKSFLKKKVLDNISFTLKPGVTTLLGENGSGKSTLLNILSGVGTPDEGEVIYKGERTDKINFSHVHDICFVHEEINYFVPMPIGEYIKILSSCIPHWDEKFFKSMQKERNIDLNKKFQSYSRGQKIQIVLMIGLASNTPILLLDEITSVIDVYGRKYFLDLIDQHVKKGKTVVITTNIIDELEMYTDNLIILKEKNIVLNKNVEEIPQDFIKIRRINKQDHPIFAHKECVWSGVNSDKSISYIVPSHLGHQVPKELLDRRKSSLEDIFIFYFNRNQK